MLLFLLLADIIFNGRQKDQWLQVPIKYIDDAIVKINMLENCSVLA